MRCKKCGGDSVVIDSRPDGVAVMRRRACLDCGHRWNTGEWETRKGARRS